MKQTCKIKISRWKVIPVQFLNCSFKQRSFNCNQLLVKLSQAPTLTLNFWLSACTTNKKVISFQLKDVNEMFSIGKCEVYLFTCVMKTISGSICDIFFAKADFLPRNFFLVFIKTFSISDCSVKGDQFCSNESFMPQKLSCPAKTICSKLSCYIYRMNYKERKILDQNASWRKQMGG